MKHHFHKTLIIVLGVLIGIFAGGFLVVGANKTLGFVLDYVDEIDQDLVYEGVAQGGPAPEHDLFADKEGGKIFFSEYEKSYRINEKASNLNLKAKSFLIGDLETGEIISSKDQTRVYPIASISKLMTAIVADENLGLTGNVLVTPYAINTYGKQGELKVGENYTVLEMLHPLLLESSNDAAEAIASSQARGSFIDNMNGKALSIGMTSTHFEDASGLSPNNTSNVSDLFKLAQYINSYRSYIFDITTQKEYQGQKLWFNNSSFRSDKDHLGGKNGYTDEALKTQIVIFNTHFGKEDRKIIYIVLKSNDVKGDIKEMRKFVDKYVSYK